MVPLDNSYIGIAVSIAGNILVSVSLNTQKLAHKRLSEEHHRQRSNSLENHHDTKNIRHGKRPQTQSERTPLLPSTSKIPNSRSGRKRHDLAVYAIEPSSAQADEDGTNDAVVIRELPRPEKIVRDLAENGTELAVQDGSDGRIHRKWLEVRGRQQSKTASDMNGEISSAHQSGQRSSSRSRSRNRSSMAVPKAVTGTQDKTPAAKSNFYSSKLWWLGLCLMALGELGNFTSYAFAPASVVAPLGTTALIANCFIAPLMLHERFRKKDILGIAFSIAGAVTIVLSSKSENKSLTPHQFIRAVSQPAFFIYAFISLGLIIVLLVLSRTRAGDKYLAIDILLCALCGGFTVLSVKAFSSFLTQNFVDCFKQWPTYPVLAVLAITAVMQIIFLNKALRRFESRVVVPTQFVSFTISAIIGSAILYRDFEDVQIGKVVAFFLGCALVFIGVVFLTSTKHSHSDQPAAGDTSQSTINNEVEVNDSQISTSSIDSQGRLLDGVTVTSRPPATSMGSFLSQSPSKVGRVLRKYNSIGLLPSRPSGSTSAVATPIRTSRPANIPTSKLFSPGYLLIAGSGFGQINDDGSDDEYTPLAEENGDLEAGRGSPGSESSTSSGRHKIQLGGQETLMDDEEANAPHSRQVQQQSPDGDCEPMTRSALMRRSGTV